MKHAMFLMFGLALSGCGSQATDIPPGTVVEARLVHTNEDYRYCRYMLPDGSLVDYDKEGECPATRTEVVEE